MILSEIIKWLLLLLAILLLSSLMQRMAENREEEQREAHFGDDVSQQPQPGDEPGEDSPYSTRSTRSTSEQEDKIRRILQDPSLADELSRMAGIGHLPADQIFDDPRLLKKIAGLIPEQVLDIFDVASRRAVVDMDLRSKMKLEEVSSGGVYQEPGRMRGLNDIPRLRLREFLQPTAIRDWRILTGQAQRMKRFDLVQKVVVLALFEDVSGSMTNNVMHDGNLRWIWARGVTIKLALQAIAGKSAFLYRQFDDLPHPLYVAQSAYDVQKFLNSIALVEPSGGGTNILRALEQAVEDIKRNRQYSEAHIVLISDGEDENVSTKRLRKILGDIKLHVVMIGDENDSLKRVAASYNVFR